MASLPLKVRAQPSSLLKEGCRKGEGICAALLIVVSLGKREHGLLVRCYSRPRIWRDIQ